MHRRRNLYRRAGKARPKCMLTNHNPPFQFLPPAIYISDVRTTLLLPSDPFHGIRSCYDLHRVYPPLGKLDRCDPQVTRRNHRDVVHRRVVPQPCAALRVPPPLRGGAAEFAGEGRRQGRRMGRHGAARRGVLVEGFRAHAVAGGCDYLGDGRLNCSWGILRLVPSSSRRRLKMIDRSIDMLKQWNS